MTQQEARLQIAQLVGQRKYEEVLPILEDLLEKNPSDREFAIYRLLVVRMLIAHWTLSRIDTGELGALWPVTKRVCRRSMISALRTCEVAKSKAVSECYRVARVLLERPRAQRIVIGIAGFASVLAVSTFFAPDESKVSGQAAAKAVTAVVSRSADAVAQVTDATVEGARSALSVTPAVAEPLSPASSAPKTELTPEEKPSGSIVANAVAVERAHATIEAKAEKPTVKQSAAVEIVGAPLQKSVSANRAARKVLGQVLSQRAIPIRQAPRFAAASVRDIDRGILLNVLEYVGSWARVELSPLGVTGFVRKEFLVSVGSEEPRSTRLSRSLSRNAGSL